MVAWGAARMVAALAAALAAGCATPAVLRRPVGGPAMAGPRAGDPLPVSALAEPTGNPPITLPARDPVPAGPR